MATLALAESASLAAVGIWIMDAQLFNLSALQEAAHCSCCQAPQ